MEKNNNVENARTANTIKVLLNELKYSDQEEKIFEVIKTFFDSKGFSLDDRYVDLLCGIFGDKIVSFSEKSEPVIGLEDGIDGFGVTFGSPENKMGRVAMTAIADDEISLFCDHYDDVGKWVLAWKQVCFTLNKEGKVKLETTNYNSNTSENENKFISVDMPFDSIISEIEKNVGNDFLPSGEIRKAYGNSVNKTK